MGGIRSRRNTHIACVNCAKWHVSCEARRPCHRCVSKGLESSCVDAPRKKSKYLAGVPDDSLHRRGRDHQQEQQRFQDPQHIVHKSKFLSNAADSEYAILSHIINQDSLLNKIPVDLLNSNKRYSPGAESVSSPVRSFQANLPPHPYPSCGLNVYSVLLGPNSQEIVGSQVDLFVNHFALEPVESADNTLGFKRLMPAERPRASNEIRFNSGINQYCLNSEYLTFPEVMGAWKAQGKHDDHIVSFALECCSPDAARTHSNPEWEHSLRFATPMEIYTLITKPFSHTPGFHHLFTYLRQRFNKKTLVEICRSLAEFRPIFIACSVTLTEEDMIFMEQCYQRTLLEYSKFIVQTGTPTCVWRRNGQISYMNEEFEILTGWSKEDLLNKMTFIVEILDDKSVVDYFKTFSKVAYRDFKGSEQMQVCNVLSPIKGIVIECCCIWTLKRDVSGLPLMILGNFMPILN
ncbi:hypothetical protein HG537_0C02010 [Torulaspora globosa]|uniref:PAS domain-containing protein n=1 Tax=Torulaspora globosa TaxID=48254 RepID=A0A7H9HP52_9SACH|nr:hypothetical protein HG537_0C02010 [Torulaspora sp. CBS 2947]